MADDDWENMDFDDVTFEDAGAAAADPEVSVSGESSKAAEKLSVGGGDEGDDWEDLEFDELTLESAARTDMSEIRPAIQKFAADGGADPLIFDKVTDKELRTEVGIYSR